MRGMGRGGSGQARSLEAERAPGPLLLSLKSTLLLIVPPPSTRLTRRPTCTALGPQSLLVRLLQESSCFNEGTLAHTPQGDKSPQHSRVHKFHHVRGG